MTPEERYAALAEAFNDTPGVALSRKKGFGADALCAGDRIFAMLVRNRLVVKLPRARVDALVASGDGERFDTGRGRLMKEWLSVDPASGLSWPSLAREALEFVGEALGAVEQARDTCASARPQASGVGGDRAEDLESGAATGRSGRLRT